MLPMHRTVHVGSFGPMDPHFFWAPGESKPPQGGAWKRCCNHDRLVLYACCLYVRQLQLVCLCLPALPMY